MAGYLAMKMKRKDLEDVNDDFSDFSLSSPARKIRRLDAELPPIMEEEEADHAEVQKLAPEEAEDVASNINNMNMEELGGLPSNHPHNESESESENENENEERALVLFNPPIINTHTHAHPYPLFHSPPSDLSLSVNSDLLLGIKNQILWSSQSNAIKTAERQGSNTNDCLAVVPWVASQIPLTSGPDVPRTEVSELMETEDMGEATMDVEESKPGQGYEFNEMSEGIHQWQQQHCMIPQLPENTTTPIVWYR